MMIITYITWFQGLEFPVIMMLLHIDFSVVDMETCWYLVMN